MKISKKLPGLIMLAFLFAFGSFSAQAMGNGPNEKIGIKIKHANEHQKVDVFLYNLRGLPTKIRIRTDTGEVIHRENIKKEVGFAKKFDLSRLPPGNYTISVEQEGLKVTQHLELDPNNLVFGGKETWKLENPTESGIASN